MCCLPLGCLKAIVFLGSVFSIAISVALLAMTIYVQAEKKDLFVSVSKGIVSGSLIGLYVSSIIFLLLGVAGLSGSIKSSKSKESRGTCLLALFSIGIFVFFVLFLVATVFFFVGPEIIFGDDCRTGAKTSLIDSLYNTSQAVYRQFCYSCGCAVNTSSDLYAELSKKLMNTSGDIVSYTDCPQAAEKNYVDVLSALEKLLGCAGWCKLENATSSTNATEGDPIDYFFYRFSNINDCNSYECLASLTNCHDAFYGFMSGKGRIAASSCLIALIVCFVNIVAVCCICYHPSKSRKANLYSRMIQMD